MSFWPSKRRPSRWSRGTPREKIRTWASPWPRGENVILELRNEDQLPHEFVSPVFTQVEFQFWGNATLVYTYTATGLRIDPGEKVALRFELPEGFSGKPFKFWCHVHGKLHHDPLQGELVVVKATHGTSLSLGRRPG